MGLKSDITTAVKAVKTTIKYGYVQPLGVKYADGGTLLSAIIQSRLEGKTSIIRIDSAGNVRVNGLGVGNSYGTRSLGRLLDEKDKGLREIIIVGEPSISGRKVAAFIRGLNTGSVSLINAIQGCAIVLIKDYNLLQLLNGSNVPTIKVGPHLTLTDTEIGDMAGFFKRHPSVLRDFRWFNSVQRMVVLKLARRDLLVGVFDFWEVLGPAEKTRLLDDLSKIDADLVAKNYHTHEAYIKSFGKDEASNAAQIKGKLYLPILEDISTIAKLGEKRLRDLAAQGQQYKQSGKLGVVVMAAGAASRFGQGPKALVKVDELRTFMQIAAEDVLQASKQAKRDIPLFVMVSPSNWEAIKKHFNDERYFRLKPEQVHFFFQIDVSPKIHPRGYLAFTPDKKGIDFAPTGHGTVVKAIQTQIKATCQRLGVETLVIKNIDNLGATVADRSFDEVLGLHLAKLQNGKKLTVELVHPKVAVDPTTRKKTLLDKGGGAMSLDGRNVLVELFAVPGELRGSVTENPFNTLSMILEMEALSQADPNALPWYITHKDTVSLAEQHRRFQFEQLLGDLTHQVPTGFVIVDREGKRGRFIPVKSPGDLKAAVETFKKAEKLKAVK